MRLCALPRVGQVRAETVPVARGRGNFDEKMAFEGLLESKVL